MTKLTYKELLDSGVHFGHLTGKWNPKMSPYIFMEKNGIHIIDLNKTLSLLDDAMVAIKQIAKSGRKILFVATKNQAKDIVSERCKELNMPFVTERWLGGMLTNFQTVRHSLKKMVEIDKTIERNIEYAVMAKRERLMLSREKAKLERVLGGISSLTRLPAAIFVVDVKREHIAIQEANRLGIPIFAITDTNSNPDNIDFVIPANDDASKSIELLISAICKSIEEGLAERKEIKEKEFVS